ncbi:hypothetical protein GCM10028784_05340 [Myceligenerans cantabricum]
MSAIARLDGLPTLDDVVGSLDDDVSPLTDWLDALGVDTREVRERPRWNADDARASHRLADDDDERCARTMSAAMDLVVGHPDGPLLLGLYTWWVGGDAWEDTYFHDRIEAMSRAFSAVWAARREGTDRTADQVAAGDAAAALLDSLRTEMAVESALNAGDDTRLRSASLACAESADGLAAESDRLSPRHAVAAEFLHAEAERLSLLYRALAAGVDAARAVFEGNMSAVADTVEGMREAESHDHMDRFNRSEIRAHRRSLERMAEAVEAGEEWLHVDEARVVYVFPFGLAGLDPRAAVESARALEAPPVVAGTESSLVRRGFEIDDVWAAPAHMDQRFDGAVIELPPVRVRPLGRRDEELMELEAEIRISLLGNHYLRLEGIVLDADPDAVHSALFRAAEEHGKIDVRFEGGERRWDRLADLATDVRDDVADLLDDVSVRDREVAAVPGRYHVLCSVLEASAFRPGVPGRRPLRDGTELTALFGAQALFHPVTNGLGSMHEWTRLSASDATFLRDVRHDGDLVATTANTTVSALLGQPHFMVVDHETFAEFVGSLDGMFGAWNEDLGRARAREEKQLKETLDPDADLDALEASSQAMRGLQLRLHDFGADVRTTLATIAAPDLTRSPTDHQYLGRLLALAQVEARGRDVSERIAAQLSEPVDLRVEAFAAERRAKSEVRTRRQRAMVNAFLAAIAVFGLTGAFQTVQAAGMESRLGGDPGQTHLLLAGGFVGLLLVASTVLAVMLLTEPRRRARRPRTSNRSGRTGRDGRPGRPERVTIRA